MIHSNKESSIQTYGRLQTAYLQQDLGTSQVVAEYNSREKQPAASLGKLFIVAATLRLVEEGALDLWQKPTLSLADYQANNYGTGSLRRELIPWVIMSRLVRHNLLPCLSLKGLLRYSIQHSDNIAAAKVADFAGRHRLQGILNEWGLADTTILDPQRDTPNVTTAHDLGQFLYEFGRGNLVEDDQLSEQILRWLPNKKVTNHLRENVPVRYKEGSITEDGFSYCHIAGYMQTANSDHLFVVLTKDKAAPGKNSTYPQETRVRELVDEMAYHLS